jgi:ketosteroid isomerase-like protein
MPGMSADEDARQVEEANGRFYQAFEARDLAEMDSMWAHGDHVRCIHPGWSMIAGWEGVRESWDAIFKDTREMRFSIGDVEVHVMGDGAWVSCTESILSQAGGNISVTTLLATNLFERRGGAWRMVHHHASHILTGARAAET